MKTALRYLRYGLEKSLWRTIIFTVISVAITFMTTRSATSSSEDRYKSTGIYMLAIMISVFAAIIPMLELSEFKNRRNLDTLYFFPIERKSMALVHFVSGFIQLAVIYTVTFASWFSRICSIILSTSNVCTCFALNIFHSPFSSISISMYGSPSV